MIKKTASTWGVMLLFAFSLESQGLEIAGKVTDDEGRPMAAVMVSVHSSSSAQEITRVFSGTDGRYRFPDFGGNVQMNSVKISSFRLGYEQTVPRTEALSVIAQEFASSVDVDFVLRPIQNVAEQVPYSAWLEPTANSIDKARTIVVCTACHTLGELPIKRFAASLAGLSEANRIDAWRGMVALMRTKMYGVIASEHSVELSEPASPELSRLLMDPQTSFFNQKDEDVAAHWLARNMPTDFSDYPIGRMPDLHGPLGVNSNTVVREFPYPEGSFVREVAVVDGRLWGVDMTRNRLGNLDTTIGTWVWHDLPIRGVSIPHTIVPDAGGSLWMSLGGARTEGVARYTPATGEWKTYTGWPEGYVTHDLSQGPDYLMTFDKAGYNWVTVTSNNKIAGFHRETGDLEIYDLPIHGLDEKPVHVGAYGAAMTADGHAWYSQVFGSVGRFNTQTRSVDFEVAFEPGEGPRRITVGDNDRLYVALKGTAQIAVIDTKNLKLLKKVALPDPSSAPYVVNWDPVRKMVWIGNSNTDVVYKYDPSRDEFTAYPLRVKDLHVRMIAIDSKSGDIWIPSSPMPARDHQQRRVIWLHPGDLDSSMTGRGEAKLGVKRADRPG